MRTIVIDAPTIAIHHMIISFTLITFVHKFKSWSNWSHCLLLEASIFFWQDGNAINIIQCSFCSQPFCSSSLVFEQFLYNFTCRCISKKFLTRSWKNLSWSDILPVNYLFLISGWIFRPSNTLLASQKYFRQPPSVNSGFKKNYETWV